MELLVELQKDEGNGLRKMQLDDLHHLVPAEEAISS